MKNVVSIFDDIELIALQNSWMHARDARAKIIVTLAFLLTLISFDKHAVSALLPLALLLIFWGSLSSISAGWLLHKLVLPVTLLAVFGFANVFFDKKPLGVFFGIVITGGFFSWCSIIERAVLSLGIVVLLIATTGIVRLTDALVVFKVPQVIVFTLLLLYRYIFVLNDEASRMNRARQARSFGRRGMEISAAAQLLGQFFIRSLARAERIHAAMLARGFGESISNSAQTCWSRNDTIFVLGSLVFLLLVRFGNLSSLLGRSFLGIFS